jgi:hypothetical protein
MRLDVSSDAEAALRALVDIVVPRHDGLESASERGVHEHVASCLEALQPGSVKMLLLLLNIHARNVDPATRFADLDPEARATVFADLAEDDAEEIRDAVDGVLVFTLGGYFSDWSGYDRASRRLDPPPVWRRLGYEGPSQEHLPDAR